MYISKSAVAVAVTAGGGHITCGLDAGKGRISSMQPHDRPACGSVRRCENRVGGCKSGPNPAVSSRCLTPHTPLVSINLLVTSLAKA